MDVITHNTVCLEMRAKGVCRRRTVFIPKLHLREKDERRNDENGSDFKWFAISYFSPPPHPFPLISPCLLFYLSLTSPPFRLLHSCLLLSRETINSGLCVPCKRWHWGRSQRPSGWDESYQSPGLGPHPNMNHGSNTGMTLGSSGSWHTQWLDCGGEREPEVWRRWEEMNVPTAESVGRIAGACLSPVTALKRSGGRVRLILFI